MCASLAVIVPFYRGMKFLDRLMASLGDQPIDEIVFVVDDGESGSALREALADRTNVIIVETTGSLGTSAARNHGLNVATAEWVTFLDQDDWWPKDFVEQLAIQPDDQVIAYDNVVWLTGDGEQMERRATTVFEDDGFTTTSFDRTSEVVKDYLPMFKLVLRRTDALRAGGYSTWAYAVEDYDFLMKLLSLGLRIDARSEPKGHHLWHGDSISRQIGAGSKDQRRRGFRTFMRLYARLSLDSQFPWATRRTFVWRMGVAAKGWLLLQIR